MKKLLKNLQYAYYAVYLAAIIAVTSGIYILKSNLTIDPLSESGIILNSLLIIFIVGSVPICLALFNYFVKKWATIYDVNVKLKKYQQASILRLTILGLGLVSGILFFYLFQPHSQAKSMIFSAGIAAIGVFLSKPSEDKINSELKLEETID